MVGEGEDDLEGDCIKDQALVRRCEKALGRAGRSGEITHGALKEGTQGEEEVDQVEELEP